MTPDERHKLRHRLAKAYREVQDATVNDGHSADDAIPEIMTAMLSLTAFVSANSGMGLDEFLQAVAVVTAEEWPEGFQDEGSQD